MPLIAKPCPACGQNVEEDTAKPGVLLDAARDKVKRPTALHICPGATLTKQFVSDPSGFLKTNVVMVDEHEQMPVGANARAISRFKIVPGQKNALRLKFHAGNDNDYVEAYWLPWRSHEATSMDLGADANFFFTSELTNCRFSLLAPDPKRPKVAHVAGDLTRPQRNQAEIQSGFCAPKDARVRRLSVSESRDQKPFNAPPIPKKHDYAGQNFDPDKHSSAFVFGQRDAQGDWKFFAQIAKGTLVEGFFDKQLTDNIQVLTYVDFQKAPMV